MKATAVSMFFLLAACLSDRSDHIDSNSSDVAASNYSEMFYPSPGNFDFYCSIQYL